MASHSSALRGKGCSPRGSTGCTSRVGSLARYGQLVLEETPLAVAESRRERGSVVHPLTEVVEVALGITAGGEIRRMEGEHLVDLSPERCPALARNAMLLGSLPEP